MKNCKTCFWFAFEKTAQGAIRHEKPGDCNYPIIELPNLPDATIMDTESVRTYINRRTTMWPDGGELCPCYKLYHV